MNMSKKWLCNLGRESWGEGKELGNVTQPLFFQSEHRYTEFFSIKPLKTSTLPNTSENKQIQREK